MIAASHARRRDVSAETRSAPWSTSSAPSKASGTESAFPWTGTVPRRGLGVDVHHHLIAVTRRARIEIRRQGGFGEQAQRVGPALRGRDLFGQGVAGRGGRAIAKQPIGGGLEGALHDGAHLRREPAADDDHAVVVDPRRELTIEMPRFGLARVLDAIHAPPRAHEPLHVRSRAGQRQIDERLLVLAASPRE